MYVLPLEVLDVILQKSYLAWVFNSSTEQRDEEIIRSLISVDVCFNKRINRQRFKKEIWRYLKGEISSTYYFNLRANKWEGGGTHPRPKVFSMSHFFHLE